MLLMVLSIAVLISQPLIAGVEYVNWEWIGAGSAVAAWTFSSLIVYHESRYDLTAGRLLRLWWVLLLIPASIRLRTDILALRSDGPESDWTMKESARIVRIVSFLPQIFLSFAGIIANDSDLAKGYQPLEGYPMQEDPGEGPSTYEDAGGCWTTYTFSWMTPLLREGTQTAIERNQLYRLQTEDCTAVNYSKLSAAWDEEMKSGRKSFLFAMKNAFGRYFAISAFYKLINDISIFTGPVMIKKITQIIDLEHPTDEDYYYGYLYAAGIFLGATVQSLAIGQYFFRGFRLGLRARASISQAVYVKAMKLSYEAAQEHSTGSIVSYMQIDAQKIADATPYLHGTWSAPLQLSIGIWLLYQEIGIAGVMGLVVLLLMIPMNTWVARKQANFTRNTMKSRDTRVKLFNEVASGIRIVKYYAWEKPYKGRIDEKRELELANVYGNAVWGAFSSFLWGATPLFVTVVSFVAFAALHPGELTASKAFTALSLFNILRFPLNGIPNNITRIIDVGVVVTRLGNFLAAEERVEGQKYTRHRSLLEGVPSLTMDQGAFKWPSPKAENEDDEDGSDGTKTEDNSLPTLPSVNLDVQKGTLVGICGSVASGKSSLLDAILNEIPQIAGKVQLNGSVAFCAQQPWIQNATLRDNILFGKAYDARLYQQVLDSCALTDDLLQFAGGDQVEIGERGINLSGGQRARVALARACYQETDIVVLDDILSAVDPDVGATLMKKCVLGLLRNSTVFLATHQTQWLNYCNHVIVMVKGDVMAQGTPEEVQPQMESIGLFKSAGAMSVDSPKSPSKSVEATAETDTKAGKGEEKDARKLVKEEDRQRGHVDPAIWSTYVKSMTAKYLIIILIFYTMSLLLQLGSSAWLGVWAHGDKDTPGAPGNHTMLGVSPSDLGGSHTTTYYVSIYAGITLSGALFVYLRVLVIAISTVAAGRRVHEQVLTAVLGAPMQFFDETPMGRIINRLSSDLAIVDVQLRSTTQQSLLCIFNLLGVLGVVIFATPWIAAAMVPLSALYYSIAVYYRRSSRELQRLDSTSKSPIYESFTEALTGVSSVRAFDAVSRFARTNEKKVDTNLCASFISTSANRWLAVRLEFVGNMLVLLTATLCIYECQHGNMTAALAGLALSYSFTLTDYLNWMIRVVTGFETQMISVERLLNFAEIEPERSTLVNKARLPANWPARGEIKFQNVHFRYRVDIEDPDMSSPLVLKNLTFTVPPGQHVGVVGRTGAGKSSLLVALFRMAEIDPCGTISIDGVDAKSVPLEVLRSQMSIIPQDPVLFSGTIRSNVDPFSLHGDDEIIRVLRLCCLDEYVDSSGLLSVVETNGTNLSVGERQLMCLGRALLRGSRVVVLDEATASIDNETDSRIQTILRESLKGCTVLTIAHRIDTILHSDRVLVLDKGSVLEDGSPEELLAKPTSVFSGFVKSSQAHN